MLAIGALVIRANMQCKTREITETNSPKRRHSHEMSWRDPGVVRHLSNADISLRHCTAMQCRGDAQSIAWRTRLKHGGFSMTSFRIVPTRFAAKLRTLVLNVSALLAFAAIPAGAGQADVVQNAADMDPPSIVIDAEYVPARAVGHVVYVPNEHEMLAMDVTSGAIRAVLPAPYRSTHPQSTGFAALTAGSVSVPAFGIVLLAGLFIAMIGIIFLRRTPISA
jgi:hypothetical protein